MLFTAFKQAMSHGSEPASSVGSVRKRQRRERLAVRFVDEAANERAFVPTRYELRANAKCDMWWPRKRAKIFRTTGRSEVAICSADHSMTEMDAEDQDFFLPAEINTRSINLSCSVKSMDSDSDGDAQDPEVAVDLDDCDYGSFWESLGPQQSSAMVPAQETGLQEQTRAILLLYCSSPLLLLYILRATYFV
ncbi:hypothetical protein B484DRAFT_453375 [Ochromonadaceae sp. CCMP2298]|nr:hypothetical protein B484DRAFT_453375 [Ochromonadaceae sp. CCMP2298]|mmetsp:Transcript_10892/g.23854  ORF Transcript_10892/g.23854 Transcript_10892/m.23854 type:complete len:192 (-) Transcript_10892:187-762(-)